MSKEDKIRLARQVLQISGIFSLFVALLLLINFFQMRKYEPLESEALTILVEQLKDDPQNDVLREEIRDFDLMVRKAYFTSEWQLRTGTILLMIGVVLFGLSLKVYSDLRRGIDPPESEAEELLGSRRTAWRWLLVAGAVLFAFAMVAGISSTNFLASYFPEEITSTSPAEDEGIEVIEIVDPNATEERIAGVDTDETLSTTEESLAGPDGTPQAQSEETPEMIETGSETRAEQVFGLEDFKKQHNSFRGPLGHGISYHKNIPTSWNGAAGTNLLWKVALSKPGYNSPVIWGNKLFIAGGDEEARIVTCFDRNTGQILWEKRADNIPGSPSTIPKTTEDTGLSAPTAAVDGHRVYTIFATGDIIAFDLDGNRAWARNLGVPRNHYGHSSSLFVWNGNVIVQYDTRTGGRMLSLEGKTGETVWDITRDNTISWASPILVNVDGTMQIVTNTDPNVAGYDAKTGEEIWKLPVMMGEVGPSCAYDDGMIYANNEYASLVAIKPTSPPEVVWESYDYLSEAASPVAHDGLLFLATSYGVFVCYDAKTGDQVWEKDFGVTLYSSPMIVEGNIYLMDNTGVMHIMKADRTGNIISEPELGEASYAIPAFAQGKIYIRGEEHLYCFGK